MSIYSRARKEGSGRAPIEPMTMRGLSSLGEVLGCGALLPAGCSAAAAGCWAVTSVTFNSFQVSQLKVG